VLLATGAPLAASWPNAAVGAYLALVPMFAGYLLFGRALAHVAASTATALSLLEPAIAAVLAVIVVGERLPAVGWAGLTLIAGCLAVLTAPRAAAQAVHPPGLAPASQPDNVPARPGVAQPAHTATQDAPTSDDRHAVMPGTADLHQRGAGTEDDPDLAAPAYHALQSGEAQSWAFCAAQWQVSM
jgi:drug/metabolite transporter, DME family